MFTDRRIRKHGLPAEATVKSMVPRRYGGAEMSRKYDYVLEVRPTDRAASRRFRALDGIANLLENGLISGSQFEDLQRGILAKMSQLPEMSSHYSCAHGCFPAR